MTGPRYTKSSVSQGPREAVAAFTDKLIWPPLSASHRQRFHDARLVGLQALPWQTATMAQKKAKELPSPGFYPPVKDRNPGRRHTNLENKNREKGSFPSAGDAGGVASPTGLSWRCRMMDLGLPASVFVSAIAVYHGECELPSTDSRAIIKNTMACRDREEIAARSLRAVPSHGRAFRTTSGDCIAASLDYFKVGRTLRCSVETG